MLVAVSRHNHLVNTVEHLVHHGWVNSWFAAGLQKLILGSLQGLNTHSTYLFLNFTMVSWRCSAALVP